MGAGLAQGGVDNYHLKRGFLQNNFFLEDPDTADFFWEKI
jgi:hypothetical protein